MKHSEYIRKQFKKGKSAYFLDEYEEIVTRFTPLTETTSACYAKQKGKSEYKIKCSESLALEQRASGKIITKTEYDKW